MLKFLLLERVTTKVEHAWTMWRSLAVLRRQEDRKQPLLNGAIARLEPSTLNLSRADFFRAFRGHYLKDLYSCWVNGIKKTEIRRRTNFVLQISLRSWEFFIVSWAS